MRQAVTSPTQEQRMRCSARVRGRLWAKWIAWILTAGSGRSGEAAATTEEGRRRNEGTDEVSRGGAAAPRRRRGCPEGGRRPGPEER